MIIAAHQRKKDEGVMQVDVQRYGCVEPMLDRRASVPERAVPAS